jgi:hypothetical protein
VVAMAVQKWNISKWLGLSGRADRFIALVEHRCGKGEYLYTPPNSPQRTAFNLCSHPPPPPPMPPPPSPPPPAPKATATDP